MTFDLLEQARANRIAALAYLDEKRADSASKGQIFDLSAIRSKRQAQPVFFSRRASNESERMAA